MITRSDARRLVVKALRAAFAADGWTPARNALGFAAYKQVRPGIRDYVYFSIIRSSPAEVWFQPNIGIAIEELNALVLAIQPQHHAKYVHADSMPSGGLVPIRSMLNEDEMDAAGFRFLMGISIENQASDALALVLLAAHRSGFFQQVVDVASFLRAVDSSVQFAASSDYRLCALWLLGFKKTAIEDASRLVRTTRSAMRPLSSKPAQSELTFPERFLAHVHGTASSVN